MIDSSLKEMLSVRTPTILCRQTCDYLQDCRPVKVWNGGRYWGKGTASEVVLKVSRILFTVLDVCVSGMGDNFVK